MTKEEQKEKYSAFISDVSEILGLGKPIDVLKLCMVTDRFFKPLQNQVKELEAQIEKMKLQYDYAFNQLCESRKILCSMLSQYRDRKEIDYFTRECGEKLLKQGVYKND